MFGLPLELQILIVNVLGLASTTLNWNWFKWEQQLEKISNVSVSQPDKLDVENIDWLKTILSWIVVTRFIIDRILLFAYVANIYTVVTRSRQNLLIVWMVLSFFKDIILEVIVIVITCLLWHATKESFPASLFVEFIVDKIISLSVISISKWCTTLKWYMQLRRIAKIRRFTIIARRSIGSIANVPGRVGRSLDDECLGIAIIRRGKYASLLNLDRHSEESFNRMNAKSLTTLFSDDTSSTNGMNGTNGTNGTNGANGANGTNDYNSDNLSVAEKSMRMLNVTAEDVMDARARIQERSYWKEQDAIAQTPEVIKEVIKQLPLEKNKEEIINVERNTQLTEDNLAKIVNSTLKKEESIEYIPVKKKEEKSNEEILVDEKEQILIENQKSVSLKSENVTSDEVDHAKSTESHDIYVISKKKKKEKKEGVEKIVQCPSFQSMNARSIEAKPCASLVRKLEAKFCPVSVNRQKWIDKVNRKGYPYEINTQLTPTSSNKKERYKILKISCGCHRALRNSSKNGNHVRSIGINDKNVEFDVNRKEFGSFKPIVNMQRSRIDKSAFKYSEAHRLKKQIQKWEESYGKHSWGSKSLAETARSSGYAKKVFDESDKLSVVNCQKSVQTETYDESMMMSDSLSERHRLKYKQKRSRRPVNLHSVHNVASSFREKNYLEACEMNMKALETNNNFTLENERETKARKRRDLLPANRKLSIEQREAIELKALKAYNELTLSEDKRELEVRKDRDSSLNYGRLTKEFEVPEMKVLKTYNDSLLEDKKEMERTRRYNLSPSFQQSIDERSTSRVRNELERSGSKRERQTGRKRDSSRDETLSECEKVVETPASVSNDLSISSCESTMISTHQNIHNNFGLNDRYARQARMPLNLWEITRNIEWTVHPRGIILINKNLQSQFLKNERFCESQRDIVDDNTASTLHSAFFFKPEIITRVFRRAHNQMRIDEFSRFPTFLRQDFDTEFVCQMNNEVVVRNSSFDYDLEWMMGNDRNNLEEQFNANDNRNTTSEHDHDMCIIIIDQEQISNESRTATEDSMTVEIQENTRSSIGSIQMTNILIFNENHNCVDNATNDNLPVQLITDALRNFNIETEGSIRDIALSVEECEDVSNVNECNNSQSRELKADDINFNEENNNECDRISSHKNAEIDDTIHKIEQLLDSNDNCLDNVNVTSSDANSSEKLDNSRDEKYLSTIDVYSESEMCENDLSLKNTGNNTSQLSDNNNNKQFNTLDNEAKKSTFHVCKNFSKLSSPSSSSLIKLDNCHAVRSSNEKLQKLIQLSDSTTMLNDQRKESKLNLKDTNYTIPPFYDRIPQCRSVEILKLETIIPDGTRNQNNNRDEEANEFLAEKIFKVHSNNELQQDDSFYDKNNDPGAPVSFDDGSLMEEFLNDPIPPLNSSYS